MRKPAADHFHVDGGSVGDKAVSPGQMPVPEPLPRLGSVPPIGRQEGGVAVTAPFSKRLIQFDGRLSSAIWQDAPVYELALPSDQAVGGRCVEEPGRVRFAWDAESLCVGFDLEDSDLVAEGTSDGQMHNTLGDCCELLIKPEEETWYWEFHVTPAGRTAAFFFPGRGRLCLPSCLQHRTGVRVAARCRGTLNDWQTRDEGWTAEMCVPIAELTAHGSRFEPGTRWRVLVGRYNYSRFLTTRGPELSAMPQISRADFHCFEEYGVLNLSR